MTGTMGGQNKTMRERESMEERTAKIGKEGREYRRLESTENCMRKENI